MRRRVVWNRLVNLQNAACVVENTLAMDSTETISFETIRYVSENESRPDYGECSRRHGREQQWQRARDGRRGKN